MIAFKKVLYFISNYIKIKPSAIAKEYRKQSYSTILVYTIVILTLRLGTRRRCL